MKPVVCCIKIDVGSKINFQWDLPYIFTPDFKKINT